MPTSNQPSYSVSTSGSTRPELVSSGPLNPGKLIQNTNNTSPLGSSPITPKHVPSFLESRNQMKNSLLMNDDGHSRNIKTEESHNGHHV